MRLYDSLLDRPNKNNFPLENSPTDEGQNNNLPIHNDYLPSPYKSDGPTEDSLDSTGPEGLIEPPTFRIGAVPPLDLSFAKRCDGYEANYNITSIPSNLGNPGTHLIQHTRPISTYTNPTRTNPHPAEPWSNSRRQPTPQYHQLSQKLPVGSQTGLHPPALPVYNLVPVNRQFVRSAAIQGPFYTRTRSLRRF